MVRRSRSNRRRRPFSCSSVLCRRAAVSTSSALAARTRRYGERRSHTARTPSQLPRSTQTSSMHPLAERRCPSLAGSIVRCPTLLWAAPLSPLISHLSRLPPTRLPQLEKPLASLLKTTPPDGWSRKLILLTDGSVSSIARVTALVRSRAAAACTTIHTVGIGTHVSHALVDGLAGAGAGTAE